MAIKTAKEISDSVGQGMKILITGFSGSGKTTWAAKSPRPLVVSTEPQGVMSILAVDPKIPIWPIKSAGDFWRLMKKIDNASSGVDEHGPYIVIDGYKIGTLVLDSMTEIERNFKDEIIDKDKDKNILDLQDWQILIRRVSGVLRWQRNLSINTVVLTLSTAEYDSGQNRNIGHSMSGRKMPYEMGQFFNAVGYAATSGFASGNPVYMIKWAGGSTPGKPAPAIRADGKLWPAKTEDITLGDLVEFVHGDGDCKVSKAIELGSTKLVVKKGLKRNK